jgi:hypothetical protein
VEEIDDLLYVRTRTTRRRFEIIAFLEYFLQIESVAHFHLFSSLPHTPRVSIDKLVVSRERWRFSPAEIEFAHLGHGPERLLAARRWARRHELPRFLFYKIPEEAKPCYLDLDSAVYVDLFAKLVRKSSAVQVVEMLPTIDDTWLVDADGQRYVSELRMVAVDPMPWREK